MFYDGMTRPAPAGFFMLIRFFRILFRVFRVETGLSLY